eukprot:scaffold3049_cov132-Isochrysis_galbana.AAC.2
MLFLFFIHRLHHRAAHTDAPSPSPLTRLSTGRRHCPAGSRFPVPGARFPVPGARSPVPPGPEWPARPPGASKGGERNTAKKYTAHNGSRTVHFGEKGYEDYTTHRDTTRRASYLARHGSGGQNWSDPSTAGFWSRWLLWGESSSLSTNARSISRRLGVPVKLSLA